MQYNVPISHNDNMTAAAEVTQSIIMVSQFSWTVTESQGLVITIIYFNLNSHSCDLSINIHNLGVWNWGLERSIISESHTMNNIQSMTSLWL